MLEESDRRDFIKYVCILIGMGNTPINASTPIPLCSCGTGMSSHKCSPNSEISSTSSVSSDCGYTSSINCEQQ